MTIQQAESQLYLRGSKMILNVNQLFKAGLQVASKNAPAMLTAFGTVGVVTTAVLAGKASFQAAKKISEAELEVATEPGSHKDGLTKGEKVKLVWPLYIGAVTSGALSCASIVLAHRVSSRRAAVIAAAYALNEGKLEEYQEKIKEKFGVKEEKEARDEIVQNRVNRDFEDGTIIFNPLEGKVLLRDDYSGRYFYGNIEDINRAVNEINREILMDDSATLTEFYEAIGLDGISTSDYFGWNTTERLEVDWSTCTTPDGKYAVHSFEFVNPPIMNPGASSSFR